MPRVLTPTLGRQQSLRNHFTGMNTWHGVLAKITQCYAHALAQPWWGTIHMCCGGHNLCGHSRWLRVMATCASDSKCPLSHMLNLLPWASVVLGREHGAGHTEALSVC